MMTLVSIGFGILGYFWGYVMYLKDFLMGAFYPLFIGVIGLLPSIAPRLGASITFLTDRTNRLIMDFVIFTIHLIRFMGPIVKYWHRYYVGKLAFVVFLAFVAVYKAAYIVYLHVVSRVLVQRYRGTKIPTFGSIWTHVKTCYDARAVEEAQRLQREDMMLAAHGRGDGTKDASQVNKEIVMQVLMQNPALLQEIGDRIANKGDHVVTSDF